MKKGLNLASSILGIIIGGLEAIGAIIILMAGAVLLTETDVAGAGAVVLILGILDIGICLSFIIISALLCKKAKTGSRGLDITLIVLCAIYLVFCIICFAVEVSNAIIIINLILSITAIGLKIAGMCVKESVATQENTLAVDKKIEELKKLKELGAIADEQYNSAIEKIIKDTAE